MKTRILRTYPLLKIIYSFSVLIFWLVPVEGQEVKRKIFGTIEYMVKQEELNPSLIEKRKAHETLIGEFITPTVFDSAVSLPIIFHVFYSSERDKPTLDQICAQVDALNRDFGKKTPVINHPADTLEGFAERAADTNISFYIPTTTKDGSPLNAINYIEVDSNLWSSDDAIKLEELNGVSPFEPAHFINVWVGNMGGSSVGYAQMPWGDASTDGIVIDYQAFGMGGTAIDRFHEGKTLTHLMGNYLGLYPIYGLDRCEDDLIFDTPIPNAPNYGDLITGECPRYRHISACNSRVEMTMNFMDATYDPCMYMFTRGQTAAMKKVLLFENGGRRSLLNGMGISADGSLCGDAIVNKECEMPSNLAVNKRTTNSIIIDWEDVVDLEYYLIQIRFKGSDSNAMQARLKQAKVNVFAPLGYDFEFRLQTQCEDGGLSDFTRWTSFDTKRLTSSEFRGSEEEPITSISIEEDLLVWSFSPNPVHQQLTVHYEAYSENATLFIHHVSGRLVQEYNMSNNSSQHQFELDNLRAGIYFISIKDGNRNILPKKIFKDSTK